MRTQVGQVAYPGAKRLMISADSGGSNWLGRSLSSYQIMIELIGAITTRTGLTVQAEAETGSYP